MRSDYPIAVDLFAGAGGFSLGMEQAGFDVRAAVEIDPIHCGVHLFNFPHCKVLPVSACDLTGGAIREAARIGDQPVDCVFGGPPCQGFSMMGQRSMADPRNRLVLEFVRLVSELQARTFVFENVKGLTVGEHKAFLHELVEAFTAHGYDVRLAWQVLDAAHYGVPQHRQRLILLGARAGQPLPNYPRPTHLPADRPAGLALQERGPDCGQALGDLPDAERFDALWNGDSVQANLAEPSAYAAIMRCEGEEDWFSGARREWDRQTLTCSTRSNHSEISRRRFAETPAGSAEPISRFFKLHPDGLCNTLRAGTDAARGAFTSPRPIHYAFPRCVTVREMLRLHGYPDWFRMHGSNWHGGREVGNSVPPPLARMIGLEVAHALGARAMPPRAEQKLGNPELLRTDLRRASAMFGVVATPSKPDRKSGARKRSQAETEAERLGALGA